MTCPVLIINDLFPYFRACVDNLTVNGRMLVTVNCANSHTKVEVEPFKVLTLNVRVSLIISGYF